MQLSVEILDHIFGFLVSHRETLIACSKDPVLSPIIERHLYYHLNVHFGKRRSDADDAFERDDLSKLVSENPRILCYVRILELQVVSPRLLDGFADTLLKFPALECVVLNPTYEHNWCEWSDVFRAALEDRLSLPTVKEVHIQDFAILPISLLDGLKNVKNLSLPGSSFVERFHASGSTLPQLESLRLSIRFISTTLLPWIKLHIKELQSLKCKFFMGQLSELLRVCSGTLNTLDVDFEHSQCMVQLF
jgi:hypothetical protein